MDQHHEHVRREDARRDLRDGVRDDEGHLVLHAEEVDVHTERVASGRVTLRKQVVTEEIMVPVTVRHERLEVIEETFDDAADRDGLPEGRDIPAAPADAAPADRREGLDAPATRTDVRHLDDGDVEITLYAERPVVSIEVVPVERVRLSRGVVTDTQKVAVDVAHEEAYLDDEGVDHAARRDADRDLAGRDDDLRGRGL